MMKRDTKKKQQKRFLDVEGPSEEKESLMCLKDPECCDPQGVKVWGSGLPVVSIGNREIGRENVG